MKRLIALGLLSAVAGTLADDTTTNSNAEVSVVSGSPPCLESTSSDRNTAIRVRWCVDYQPFKPSKHTVTIGEAVAFNATDHEGVRFTRDIDGRTFAGICVSEMEISDIKTKQRAMFSAIPAKYIEACGIRSRSSGVSDVFPMTRRCDASIQGNQFALFPIGLVVTMRGQRCTVSSDGTPKFSGLFLYE